MPPVVVVNGRCLPRPITGVERYTREVLSHLPSSVRVVAPAHPRDGLSGHAWEQLQLPRLVPAHALLWSPANTGPIAVRRQVVTIHDVSPLDHPEWFQRSFAAWYRWLFPRLAARVRRIVTDSAFSRDRIVARLGVTPERVAVVPCGVSPRFAPAQPAAVERVRERYGLTGSYALAVGSLEPRKNLPRLCRAWELVRRRVSGAELAIVGAGRGNFARSGIERLPPGVRLLGVVPDGDLPALMTGADALIAVSLYEGFGLPALEAMACGTAVVASDGTGIAEAVGNAAVKVSPRSEDAIAAGVVEVLTDDGRRRALRQAGFARAKEFGWERTGTQLWAVLCEAAVDD